jgi:hypothetical protein
MFDSIKIAPQFSPKEQAVVFQGGCMDLVKEISSESIQLMVTSPQCN